MGKILALLLSAVSFQAFAALHEQQARLDATPNGHYIARRCGPNADCQSEPGVQSYYVGYHSVPSTAKPAGARRQTLSFDVWSPDYFSMAQTEHIAIGLHGQFPPGSSDSEAASRAHGLGIIIGDSDCGVGATSVRVEARWPTGSTVTGRCTPHVLRNNVTYAFRVTVSDSGEISYTVTDTRTGTLVLSDSLDGRALFADSRYGFPSQETGYFIIPAARGNADYSLYLTNLRVSWQS